jgi:hypothetical protein
MSYFNQPIAVTSAVTLNRVTHAGNIVNMNSATGFIVTLPASTGRGDVYELFVTTTVSSGNHVIAVANATDVMQGVIHLTTDIAGSSLPTITGATASCSDTITMNGGTTGGVRGSWVRLKDAALGIWLLDGALVCTGTEATPFSAAV